MVEDHQTWFYSIKHSHTVGNDATRARITFHHSPHSCPTIRTSSLTSCRRRRRRRRARELNYEWMESSFSSFPLPIWLRKTKRDFLPSTYYSTSHRIPYWCIASEKWWKKLYLVVGRWVIGFSEIFTLRNRKKGLFWFAISFVCFVCMSGVIHLHLCRQFKHWLVLERMIPSKASTRVHFLKRSVRFRRKVASSWKKSFGFNWNTWRRMVLHGTVPIIVLNPLYTD